MGAINIGAQVLDFSFQELATAANFNRIFRDVMKAGVYQGGGVSIVAANSIQISEFTAIIRSTDLSGDKAVHMRTNDPVILNTPNAPNGDYTIYMTFAYIATINNFVDFSIRLSSAPAISGEVKICRVVNNGAGVATTIAYDTRTRGTIDVDIDDELTTDVDPTQDYHVGNRAYNDLRYVNHNGPSTWDIQVLKSADGTLGTSRIWFDGASAQEWELQDRTGILALHYETFRLGMIQASLEDITPSADAPWLNIALNHVTLDSVGAGSWPQLVPFLRGLSGGAGYIVTGYTPGVSTILQMDNTDPATEAFVLALYEDNLYHGDGVENYSNYKTLTVSTAFGDIVLGEYNIVDIDPVLFTIEIDANTVGPSAAGNVDHYPFRIKASTTTARWYGVDDSVLISSGGADIFPLFRCMDRVQAHSHIDGGHTHTVAAQHQFFGGAFSFFPGPDNPNATVSTAASTANLGDPTDSLTIGFDPVRYGQTTRPRGLAVYKYIFGVEYTP